jgi:hypothetical protein
MSNQCCVRTCPSTVLTLVLLICHSEVPSYQSTATGPVLLVVVIGVTLGLLNWVIHRHCHGIDVAIDPREQFTPSFWSPSSNLCGLMMSLPHQCRRISSISAVCSDRRFHISMIVNLSWLNALPSLVDIAGDREETQDLLCLRAFDVYPPVSSLSKL